MAERSDYYDPESPKLARRVRVSLTMILPFGLFGASSLAGSGGTLLVGQIVLFAVTSILIYVAITSYVKLRRREIAAVAKAARPQPTPRRLPRPQVATVAAPAPASSTTSPVDDKWAWADEAIAAVSEPATVALAPVVLPTLTPAPPVPAPAPAAVAVADKPVPAKPATQRNGGRFWNRESGTAIKTGELVPVGAATGE